MIPRRSSIAVRSTRFAARPRSVSRRALAGVLAMLAATPASATFHLMQIERVVGGVGGDPAAHAIQLRMRSSHQGELEPSRLVSYDANGVNPIVLFDFVSSVPDDETGSTVLVISEDMADHLDPEIEPDFVMARAIPRDRLTAGSLTFETDDGTTIVARLSWGGSAYDGPDDVSSFNDDNDSAGAPLTGPLQTTGTRGYVIELAAGSRTSSNATDYTVLTRDVTLTNNAGESATIVQCAGADADGDDDGLCDAFDACPDRADDGDDRDGDGVGDACDECPDDADKTEPGDCGCGNADTDADDDGVSDCLDDPNEPDDEMPAVAPLCGFGLAPTVAAMLLARLAHGAARQARTGRAIVRRERAG